MLDCESAVVLLAARDEAALTAVDAARLAGHLATCLACHSLGGAGLSSGHPTFASPASSGLGPGLPTIDPAVYTPIAPVGQGGMGRVVRATDRRLGREVALKELLASEARVRFEREARITARLQHPGIIPIYEAGQWPSGAPFYAMKMVSGRSLEQEIRRRATLESRLELLRNVVAVADAIAYAHSQRVVHRDLKPANVIIGEFGESIIIDWGLAKDLSDLPRGAPSDAPYRGLLAAGGTHGPIGTPAYMAPEQAAGAAVDERVDVYALGALLYHLLAGVPPHAHVDGAPLGSARPRPTPLAQRDPAPPSDLIAIVETAMAEDPGARYPGARELAEDLRRFERGQRVSTHRYSLGALAARFVARHRAIVATAAAALVAIAAVSSYSVVRVIREASRARQAATVAEASRASAEAALDRSERLNADLRLATAKGELETNPDRTLAWLRGYPLDAPRWAEARALAADAIERGVHRRSHAAHGSWRPAPSPDGRTLAVESVKDRATVLLDLPTGSSRRLGERREVYAFSPDGRWLVGVWFKPDANRREVVAWDLATGAERRRTLPVRGASGLVFAAATTVALVHGDEAATAVATWDLASDRLETVGRSDGEIRWLAAARDGTLAWAVPKRALVLRERRTGVSRSIEIPGLRPPSDQAIIGPLAFGPAGELAVVYGRQVVLLEPDGARVRWRAEEGFVHALAFSPDGELLATGGDGITNPGAAKAALWRVADGARTPLDARQVTGVGAIAFSRDGSRLATAGIGPGQLWTRDGRLLRALTGRGGVFPTIGFALDDSILWTDAGGRDGVQVWQLGTARRYPGKAAVQVADPARPRTSMAPIASDGAGLLVVDADQQLHRWRPGEGDRALGACWAPLGLRVGGGRALCLTRNDRVHVLDTDGGGPGPILAVDGHLLDARPSVDGDRVIVVARSGAIAAHDAETGAELYRLPPRPRFGGGGPQLSPDARSVAYRLDGEVVVVDTATGAARSRAVPGGDRRSPPLRFSPSGRRLAVRLDEGSTMVWDLDSGREWILRHDRRDELFFPHDRWLVEEDGRGTLFARDLDSGASHRLDGVGEGHLDVAASPDGTALATSSASGGARLWSLLSPGVSRVVRPVRPSEELAFSLDGKTLFVRGPDEQVWAVSDDLPHDPAALRAWLETLPPVDLGDALAADAGAAPR